MCTRLCLCPPRVCFPVLCKFWWLYGGVNGDLRRMLDATKKIRHVQGQRRSPRKMVEGGKLHLESNPLPTRYAQRAQINLVHTLHRDPTETDQNCVWVSPAKEQISSGLPQGQGLLVQQTWVWHKPSWRRSPLTSP